jgi:hypothetical protein
VVIFDDTTFDCGAVTTSLVKAVWLLGLGAVINNQGSLPIGVVLRVGQLIPEQFRRSFLWSGE